MQGSRAAPEAAARSEAQGPGEDAGRSRTLDACMQRYSLSSGCWGGFSPRHPEPPAARAEGEAEPHGVAVGVAVAVAFPPQGPTSRRRGRITAGDTSIRSIDV